MHFLICKDTLVFSIMNIFIHSFSAAYPVRGCRRGLSQLHRGKAGYTLDKSPVHHRADIQRQTTIRVVGQGLGFSGCPPHCQMIFQSLHMSWFLRLSLPSSRLEVFCLVYGTPGVTLKNPALSFVSGSTILGLHLPNLNICIRKGKSANQLYPQHVAFKLLHWKL